MSDTIPLSDIAHGRSGDKGNHANVAVIAYTEAGYAWLRQHLTADVVAAYFAPMAPKPRGESSNPVGSNPARLRVERFKAANVWGLNFMLYDILAGGASQSLRVDTQGKTLALTLLQMRVALPSNGPGMFRTTTTGGDSSASMTV